MRISTVLSGTPLPLSAYPLLEKQMGNRIRIGIFGLAALVVIELAAGTMIGPSILHPARRPLTPQLVQEADAVFAQAGATRSDVSVRAPDGTILRGWKV